MRQRKHEETMVMVLKSAVYQLEAGGEGAALQDGEEGWYLMKGKESGCESISLELDTYMRTTSKTALSRGVR
jgi:hypothetical protein